MKELTFKRSGLAWKLATTLGPMKSYVEDTDICTYWRAVAMGSAFATFLAALAAVLLWSIGDFIGYVAAVIAMGYFFEIGIGIIGATLLAVLLLTALGIFIDMKFCAWKDLRRQKAWEARIRMDEGLEEPPKDSFLREAYRSWKEKTCVKVKFE